MNNSHFPRINERLCNQTAPGAVFFITPGVAVVCAAGTIQLNAFTNDGTADTAVNTGITWQSSNTAVATVSGSGLVTRVAEGNVTIRATWNGQTAYAYLSLFVSGTCCAATIVGTVLVVDGSPSMNAALEESSSAFYTARLLALNLIGALNAKDQMSVIEFDGAAELLVPLTFIKADLSAVTMGLTRATLNEEETDFTSALRLAMETLETADVDKRVIVLISDGIGEPAPGSQDLIDLLMLAQEFKDKGGVIIAVGINATGDGYTLMRDLSTPGYFVNVSGAIGSTALALTALLALKPHYCAG